MKRDDSLMWSALGFMFGCLLLVYGAVLHNTYRYSVSYNTALHVHFSGFFIFVGGGIIAFLGLMGVIGVIFSKYR